RYGCRVTTVTISKEQYQYATEWVRRERLQNRVEVLFSDYRKLSGQFDKIVSIEMAEAIGYRYFDTYFQKLASLLKPGGLAALQYITIPEPRYERYLKNTDFIQIHIFPGSCLLSNLEVLQSIHRTSDLVLLDLETIGQHYATTLRHWRNNVLKNRNKLQQLGYSEKFLRKWIYYLTFCEAGFAERVINDVQVVFGRANQTTYRDFHGHLPAYKDRFGYGK
ncbi:MAG: class I SAM-dependent methyltransferase, partial [Turneriella sp.]|nr:class I SAM-dependent methyltransferase [Turneriella sp.]